MQVQWHDYPLNPGEFRYAVARCGKVRVVVFNSRWTHISRVLVTADDGRVIGGMRSIDGQDYNGLPEFEALSVFYALIEKYGASHEEEASTG